MSLLRRRVRWWVRCARLCLLFAYLYAGGAVGANEVLNFGLIGVAEKDNTRRLWEPILADLSVELGRPVRAIPFEDYASAIWYIRSGRIQLSWMGNEVAMEAVDRADAEVFAQSLNEEGITKYHSLLIARKESEYHSADDVLENMGKITFGFGNRHSTSGTTVPTYYLFMQRERSSYEFYRIRHANHEANFKAVVNKEVDVATLSSVMYRRFADWYPEDHKRTKVIWQSPVIPTYPLVWRKALDPGLKDAIAAFFLGYGNPAEGKSSAQLAAEKAALRDIKYSGFRGSDNSQLLPIRRLKLHAELRRIEEDQTLAPALRDRRIQTIQTQLNSLSVLQ